MRILITGGAGFIGSHLAEHLSKRGDQVTVIDNLSTGRKTNIDGLNVRFFYDDISDPRTVQGVFKEVEPEVVVHAAASYKDPENWWSDVSTNCLGTVNIVKSSEEYHIKRLIYFQTALGYGIFPNEQPVTTVCHLNPKDSSYAISKTTGEYYIRLSKLNYISFRLANVAGARNLSGPLSTFYKRLSSGQKCFVMDTRRDFIYIDDLVKVVMRAIDGEGTERVYHISSGKDYSILELYKEIRKAMDLPDEEIVVKERTKDDAPTLLIDPTLTEAHFSGWKADTPLEVLVKNHIEWCKKNEIGETYTHLKGVR
jgi:UDP-glucose 4-epimerase